MTQMLSRGAETTMPTSSVVEHASSPAERAPVRELRTHKVAHQIIESLTGDPYAQARLVYTGHPSYEHPSEHPHTANTEPFGEIVETQWNKLGAVTKFDDVAAYFNQRISDGLSTNLDLDGALASFAHYNARVAEYNQTQEGVPEKYADRLLKEQGINGTEGGFLKTQQKAKGTAFPQKPSDHDITTFMNVLRTANE